MEIGADSKNKGIKSLYEKLQGIIGQKQNFEFHQTFTVVFGNFMAMLHGPETQTRTVLKLNLKDLDKYQRTGGILPEIQKHA